VSPGDSLSSLPIRTGPRPNDGPHMVSPAPGWGKTAESGALFVVLPLKTARIGNDQFALRFRMDAARLP